MIKNILIVKGGKYAEAEVSRKTAFNVEKALKAKGYNTISIEPQDNLISYINDNKQNIDIIFNALHGSWGEDGKIQGLFEYFSIPYTHSGVSSSAVGMNKFLSKSIFLNNNIVVPKGRIFINKNLNIEEEFARPYVIKPINEGSSVGVKLIKKNTDINIFLKNIDIYLVDTFGETNIFHQIGATVFLGGSIIKRGGQNPLEAASYGARILHGPNTDNFKDVYKLLKKLKVSNLIISA